MGLIRFEENGWRARVGDGFDESSVVRIASAIGRVWAVRHEGATVLVGYDNRRDSKRLAAVAGQVLSACGLRACVSDRICPTPALGWSVAQDPLCVGGLMLTASRLPYEYGGILVRQADGGPISPLFASMVDQSIEPSPTPNRGPIEYVDLVTGYRDAIIRGADTSLIAGSGLRVVLDPMYGAGSGLASEILKRIGCDVIAIHDKPVSDFRGLHPDACEPWVDACERAVVDNRADLGIVLDGDCTRFVAIDDTGKMVSPHDTAPLVLDHVVRQRGKQGRVVSTAATSVRIVRQAERLDCEHTMVPVGFNSIYSEFLEHDVILATNERGAICIPEFFPERCAILGASMLLELVAGTNESVRELVSECESNIGTMEYATRDIRVDFGRAQSLRNLLPGMNPPLVAGMEPVEVTHPGGLRVTLPDGSWLLVRVSRSRGALRAACEAPGPAERSALLGWASSLASGAGPYV